MRTDLTLRYSNKETALAVARALSGNPDVTEFPPDGWLGGVYYNISALNGDGSLWRDGVLVPGYHLMGLWHGPLETVPPPVAAAMVSDGFGCVWG